MKKLIGKRILMVMSLENPNKEEAKFQRPIRRMKVNNLSHLNNNQKPMRQKVNPKTC